MLVNIKKNKLMLLKPWNRNPMPIICLWHSIHTSELTSESFQIIFAQPKEDINLSYKS